jgi:hypothetical protein
MTNYRNLESQALFGVIPAAIGSLVHLETLNLAGNSIRGGIPTAVISLVSLRRLDLSHNSLSKDVPALITLSLLKIVKLSGNYFTGAFDLATDLIDCDIAQNGCLCVESGHRLATACGRSLPYCGSSQ